MERIALLLGIKIGEPFQLYDTENKHYSKHTYVLENNGVYAIKNDIKEYKTNMLEEIFRGHMEVIKKVTLTKTEKILIDCINSKYKYIAREMCGDIRVFTKEPHKVNTSHLLPDIWYSSKSDGKSFPIDRELFKFIEFYDDMAYSIDFLKNCEVIE